MVTIDDIKNDPETAWAWHCNIAMPLLDVLGLTHKDANQAAAHLMRHLFDVDITKDERFAYDKSGAQRIHEFMMAADGR